MHKAYISRLMATRRVAFVVEIMNRESERQSHADAAKEAVMLLFLLRLGLIDGFCVILRSPVSLLEND